MKKLILFLTLILAINLEIPSTAWSADPIWLPNLPGYATGTAGTGPNAGRNGVDVNLISPVSVTNPADGPTGSAVPADASYAGGNKGGLLTGLLIGQQTMANSLACVLPSDQSAIPVSESGAWSVSVSNFPATQPVSGTVTANQGTAAGAGSAWAFRLSDGSGFVNSFPNIIGAQGTVNIPGTVLDTFSIMAGWDGTTHREIAVDTGGLVKIQGGNATAVKVDGSAVTQPVSQSGAPWSQNITQFGGNAVVTGTGASGLGIPRVTVSSDSTVILGAGSAIVGKVGIDQTTPGTTNGVQVNAALPAGSNVIGKVSIDQTTPGTTNLVQVGGSLPAGTNSIGTVKTVSVGNANAAFSQTSVTTTASTISAPANAVRVFIQGDSGNTDCIRYRFDGSAATASVGLVAQPGQDSGQLDSGMSVSVAACSGTQKVNVQYFAQ